MMKAPEKILLFIFCLCLLPVHVVHASPDDKPLIFGFLPSRSPVTLFRHYQPLVDYLAEKLDRKIIMETAVDYPKFLLKTDNRHYDFVLTAPHFALLAIDSGKYSAPITYTKGLMADILVKKDSPITGIEQLVGKTISTPPDSAIISMAGKYYISQLGLNRSKAPQYRVTRSHNDSVHAMLAGDADASIASFNVTRQFLRKNIPVRKIADTGMLPGMAILIARNLPHKLRVSFIQTLVSMDNEPKGKEALNKMGYSGYRRSRNNEFELARPYIRSYKESLSKGKD
ncbi:MAG: phosphate/phosphite/phosphonate ABC transporter substrate-binding protein [Gammaproteobacteria bacterium]|nr:phosphate/phosphite/phosphonate ABC transporter substrate-binding protein [Gammaproteobacteria bacterium]